MSLLAKQRKPHLPGEEGIWVFVIGDMMVFAMFFGIFVFYRAADVELYQQSREQLDISIGLINTILLLTSSWFAVTAVNAYKELEFKQCKNFIGLATLCGLGFVVIKFFEYSAKIEQGYNPNTNEFFMFYYLFTGIHLVHVLVGVAILAYLYLTMRTRIDPATGEPETNLSEMNLESSATYWHMVDLLWIVLFPLIYLLP